MTASRSSFSRPQLDERRHLLVEERFQLVFERDILGRPGEVHESDDSVRFRWTSPSRLDQEAFRDAVRAFHAAEAPKEYVRRMAEHDDAGITPEVWRKIVDLGWTGLARAARRTAGSASASSTRSSCRRRWAAPCSRARSSRRRSSRRSRRAHSGSTNGCTRSRSGRERGTVAIDEAGHRRSDRTHPRACDRPRFALQARRREADGDGRPHRRLGARPGAHARRIADVPRREPEALRKPRRRSTSRASSRALEFDETRAHPRRSARRPRGDLAPRRRRRRACCSPPN